MAVEGELDYALARVHAQHGARMTEIDWRRLEAGRNLEQYLDAAHTSPLAGWTARLRASDDCHTLERVLRREWRRYVEGMARWHPDDSQPWLAWCAWLPTLSLLTGLTRAESAPTWMLSDPICVPVAPGSLAERAAALAHTPLAPLVPAMTGHVSMAATWFAHWRKLTPRLAPDTHELLERLIRTIDRHIDSLVDGAEGAVAARAKLSDRLARLFRTSGGTLVASICHLALLALDLERLRGGLTSRCILPAHLGEAAA